MKFKPLGPHINLFATAETDSKTTRVPPTNLFVGAALFLLTMFFSASVATAQVVTLAPSDAGPQKDTEEIQVEVVADGNMTVVSVDGIEILKLEQDTENQSFEPLMNVLKQKKAEIDKRGKTDLVVLSIDCRARMCGDIMYAVTTSGMSSWWIIPRKTEKTAADATAPTLPATVQQADVAELEPLPVSRSARWAPMLVSYQRMNLHHPTLYYRSIQERREFPDAVARGCCGRTCSALYEIVQFPAQLALSPLLVLMNPPWQLEQARP